MPERVHQRLKFEIVHTLHRRYLLAAHVKPLSRAVRGCSCTGGCMRRVRRGGAEMSGGTDVDLRRVVMSGPVSALKEPLS